MQDTSLVLTRDDDATDVIATDALVEAARAYMAEARAESTRSEYARLWAAFVDWCALHKRSPLPAVPDTIARWMTAMAKGIDHRKPQGRSSINKALSAVLLAHRTAGHPLDRKHPLIAETWQGISRAKAKEQTVRKASAMLGDDLQAMLDSMKAERKRTVIAARDRALLALGWAGALRRSELVGLDWMERGNGQGHVTIDNEAVRIHLATSKASQDAAECVVIPRANMPTAALALDAWAQLAGLRPGAAVFRAVDQHEHISPKRLTARSVALIVKSRVAKLARARGKSKDEARHLMKAFSGHSLRAGFVTTCARKKIPSYDIRNHTRHKSVQTVEGYVREANKLTDSVLKEIGF